MMLVTAVIWNMILADTYLKGKYLMDNEDWLLSGMHVLSEDVLLESFVNSDYSPGWAYIAFAGIKMDSWGMWERVYKQ